MKLFQNNNFIRVSRVTLRARLPHFAVVAQLVEQLHGKEQVVSSILTNGSAIKKHEGPG